MGVVVAVAVASAAAPADASCGTPKRIYPGHSPGNGRPPLAIGDSVLLGAVEEVAAVGIEVDARGCRQMTEGLALIRARRRAGTLPRLVIVALGTNWIITSAEIDEAVSILGPKRTLVMVTPRETGGHGGADAAVIRAAGRRRPRRVKVLDWVAYAAGHGGWTYSDGIHLAPAGQYGMASLLKQAFRWNVAPVAPPCP
jgi:hypothetical protein